MGDTYFCVVPHEVIIKQIINALLYYKAIQNTLALSTLAITNVDEFYII